MISTGTVVNAAGPYAKQIGELGGLTIPVLPFRRHIFITDPIDDRRAPGSHIMVIDFETTFYFHREGAGILFGMSDPREQTGFDTSVNWEFLEEVTRVAVGRLPVLEDAGIAHAWAGLYEMTPDAMPIIGPAGIESVFIIAGFSGHGFQHSPAAGRILAQLIAGRVVSDIDISAFAADRFSTGFAEIEKNVV
jgi:sarcosine oxidase subunit beta